MDFDSPSIKKESWVANAKPLFAQTHTQASSDTSDGVPPGSPQSTRHLQLDNIVLECTTSPRHGLRSGQWACITRSGWACQFQRVQPHQHPRAVHSARLKRRTRSAQPGRPDQPGWPAWPAQPGRLGRPFNFPPSSRRKTKTKSKSTKVHSTGGEGESLPPPIDKK